jgi:hypothetical protein
MNKYYLELQFLTPGTSFNERYTKEVHERMTQTLKGIPLTVISENALNAVVKGISMYKDILKLENVAETERIHVSVKIIKVEEMLT